MVSISKHLSSRLLIISVLLVFALYTAAPLAVNAAPLSGSDREAILYDANLYREQGAESSCEAGSITNVAGSDNAEKTWNFFIGKGLKPWMAAGFMGNMQEEAHFEPRLVEYGLPNSRGETSQAGKPSSLDDNVPPNAESNGRPGYGIIQWTAPGRKQGLRDKAASDPARRIAGDMTLQLEYMWQELTGGYKASTLDPVLASTTVEEATKIVTYHYEIPSNKEVRVISRTKTARGFLAKYGSTTPPAASAEAPAVESTQGTDCGADTTSQAPSANAAGIVAMALNYSWPESGRGLTPKPEYAAAIQKYNPGASEGGADCGVFVGTVMHATGADTSYPKGGTSAQMDYVTSHPDKYDIATQFSVEDLRPGDILIVTGGSGGVGHTYIFVGPQPNGRNKADASLKSRMPNLGYAEAVDSNGRGHYTRARLK